MKKHVVRQLSLGISLAIVMTLESQTQAQTVRKPTPKPMNQSIVNPAKVNDMNNQAAQTVRTFLTAVQQGDHSQLAQLLHPDVQWYQPGTNRFAGVKQTSTAVFQMVGGMVEATANTLQLAEIKQLAVNGNQVACLVCWKAVQPGGGVLDVDNIDVYTVEGGRIVKATIYSEDMAQEDSFWGK